MLIMTTLMMVMYIISYMFYKTKMPLTQASLVIVQTIIVAALMYLVVMKSWYLFMIVMIFISGMMVLFSYISALASNNLMTPASFMVENKLLLLFFFLLVIASSVKPYLFMENSLFLNTSKLDSLNLNNLYSFPSLAITVILMAYLLISLIVVVKITFYTKGPIKEFEPY